MFYRKPSESVAQSYRRETAEGYDNENTGEDFVEDDEEAMFGHLVQSETNGDNDNTIQSRRETFEDQLFQKDILPDRVDVIDRDELSEKVSFNLENLSHIRHTNEESHLHTQISNGLVAQGNPHGVKASLHSQNSSSYGPHR